MPLPSLIALSLAVAAAPPAITIEADATDVAQRIVHVKLTVPAAPGALTLHYPKWIPGEHGPTGPIDGVVNLQLTAAGKRVPWRRDPVDMYALHVEVPAGATSLSASFDFVSPTEGGSFSGTSISTPNLAVLSWNHFAFVPDGKSDEQQVVARLKLPRGWELGTALPIAKRTGDVVDFQPASFTTVVDSPALLGRYFRRFVLDDPHAVDVAAESAAALEVPAATVTTWKQLVAEAGALFGSRHYRRYEFLLALSDEVEAFGLEHHESSDNRMSERALVDKDLAAGFAMLLPHEYAHSWNGKYRRPAGLATSDYVTPMNGEMLWVYEGLTQYLGMVLGARSGVEDGEVWAGDFGYQVASISRTAGRRWRPLQDTADFAQHLYESSLQWSDLRRSVDFYWEAVPLWLDVDVRIRTLSGGSKSLDDFVRAFHGGAGGKPELAPYTFDELCDALNAVAPFDWRGYFRKHLDGVGQPPADGIGAAGWRVGWVEDKTSPMSAWEKVNEVTDETTTIGLLLSAEDQTVKDVIGGSAAYAAGIVPGMKVLGVNGRMFSTEVLTDALKAAKTGKAPIELLVSNSGSYRVVAVNYHDGLRYPKLERDPKRPDVLAQILAPKTPRAPKTPKP